MRHGRYSRHRQQGVAAVETVLVMPVLLAGVMMLFEVARLVLVLIIGNLALEAALDALRLDGELLFTDTGSVAEKTRGRMVSAAYGYLAADEIEVRVVSYPSLAAFGNGLASGEEEASGEDGEEDDSTAAKGYPILEVEVDLTQPWITALPALLGFDASFTHTYRQILGTLYRPAEAS